MTKLNNMRVIYIPPFTAVSSGPRTFDDIFGENGFDSWCAGHNETVGGMRKWISESDIFEYGDFPMSGMCNMPGIGGGVDSRMCIAQQQIFLPLKYREGNK